MRDEVKDYALAHGLFVLLQNGDSIEICNPRRLHPCRVVKVSVQPAKFITNQPVAPVPIAQAAIVFITLADNIHAPNQPPPPVQHGLHITLVIGHARDVQSPWCHLLYAWVSFK